MSSGEITLQEMKHLYTTTNTDRVKILIDNVENMLRHYTTVVLKNRPFPAVIVLDFTTPETRNASDSERAAIQKHFTSKNFSCTFLREGATSEACPAFYRMKLSGWA